MEPVALAAAGQRLFLAALTWVALAAA